MSFALAEALRRRLDTRLPALTAGDVEALPGPGAADLLHEADPLLARGKRTRVAAAAAGWLAAGGADAVTDSLESLGLALEVFQAHALIHDDIIDHARTRRGLPAVHVAFADAHTRAGLIGSASDYGTASAILLGDYLLARADDLAHEACERVPAAWARWSLMTREVAYGQYLDIRAECEPGGGDESTLERALEVVTRKSANYSVVHPTVLGALLAGASPQLAEALAALTRPWGLAFQLRDDDLGVFGDAEVTGKPSGDDLREGKRTVLLALALARLGAEDAEALSAMLGRDDLNEDDVARARQLITDCGARAAHEAMIARYRAQGEHQLRALDVPQAGREALAWLGDILVNRRA